MSMVSVPVEQFQEICDRKIHKLINEQQNAKAVWAVRECEKWYNRWFFARSEVHMTAKAPNFYQDDIDRAEEIQDVLSWLEDIGVDKFVAEFDDIHFLLDL